MISDVMYSLFCCEHNWYSVLTVSVISIDEMRHCRHICGGCNFISSFRLCLRNWCPWTECWSYFRASYMFLRQRIVLHRLQASVVPFDAICAWNVCVVREPSSACTTFIQPREFRGLAAGVAGGSFLCMTPPHGVIRFRSFEVTYYAYHEGPQCSRTSDIPGRFYASRWGNYVASNRRLSITQWHSVISQKNGILHTAVFDV